MERPDVAEYFGIPALATTGFRIDVNFREAMPGDYAVEFHMRHDGRKTYCESGKSLIVE